MSIFMIWLIVRLIFLSVSILTACIIFVVVSYQTNILISKIFRYFKQVYIQKFRGKKIDPDIVIIGSMFGVYLLLTGFIWKYAEEPSLGLQIQFTGISLGSLAAIIAFRNYRRKSGVELLANYESNWDSLYGWKVKSVTISNLKDKKIQVLEIYLLLDGKLPLLLNSYKDKPIILDGYVTEKIVIPPPTNYVENQSVLNLTSFFEFDAKNQLLIVTPEKIVHPKWLIQATSNLFSDTKIISFRNDFMTHNGERKTFPFTFGYVVQITLKDSALYLYIQTDKKDVFVQHLLFNDKFERLLLGGQNESKFSSDLRGKIINNVQVLYDLVFKKENAYFQEQLYDEKPILRTTIFTHTRNINRKIIFRHGKLFDVLSSSDKNNTTGVIQYVEQSQ